MQEVRGWRCLGSTCTDFLQLTGRTSCSPPPPSLSAGELEWFFLNDFEFSEVFWRLGCLLAEIDEGLLGRFICDIAIFQPFICVVCEEEAEDDSVMRVLDELAHERVIERGMFVESLVFLAKILRRLEELTRY